MRAKISDISKFIGIICTLVWLNPAIQIMNPLLAILPMMLWLLLIVYLDFVFCIQILLSPEIICYSIYLIAIVLNKMLGRAPINTHDIIGGFILYFSLFYSKKGDKQWIKWLLYINYFYLFLVGIFSLYYFTKIPTLSRLLASGSDVVFKEYANPFTASYSTVYLFTLLLPIFLILGIHKSNGFRTAVPKPLPF